MNLNTDQQNKIRDYLLGRLPEDELEALDQLVVADPKFYEELLIVEDELVDEYLNKELTASEEESFEKYFLITPERHQKLIFSKDLKTYLDSKQENPVPEPEPQPVLDTIREVRVPPPKPWYYSFLPIQSPVFSFAVIVILIALVAGVSWLVLRDRYSEIGGTIYAVTLATNTTRGIDQRANKIQIPPGTGTVELKSELRRDEYATYEATLLADDASTLWKADNLQARSEAGTRFISVRVPARLLPPGAYRLKLRGVLADGRSEDLPGYQFTIIL